MEIYEKIFARLEELHMSQSELSRRTGISTSTISDWKKKKINPQADKLAAICKALGLSFVDLLCEEEDIDLTEPVDYFTLENTLFEVHNKTNLACRKRLLMYYEQLAICNEINASFIQQNLQRNVSVIQGIDGKNIVVINDIRFAGKRSIDWKDVREYLKEFIGDFYIIASTGDTVYIGSDLPNEYTGSKYTHSIKGTNAKAKANAAQGLPELIEIAVGGFHRENKETKHVRDAKYGWYRYDASFALPIYGENDEIDRYNVFHKSLIIRHANDGKKYLYDIIDIKKETSNPLGS